MGEVGKANNAVAPDAQHLFEHQQGVFDHLLVLKEMLRIGRYGIVGFPNFAHWRLRFGLFTSGRAPKSPALPFEWYDTPNIRVLSIKDFFDYCTQEKIAIVQSRYLMGQRWYAVSPFHSLANWLTHIGIFVISRIDG